MRSKSIGLSATRLARSFSASSSRAIALGSRKKNVGATGLGFMQYTWIPSKKTNEEQFDKCLVQALEDGANFWNTGDFYGRPDPTENLELLANYLAKNPEALDRVYISAKGGVDTKSWMPDGSPEAIERSIRTICDVLSLNKEQPLDMFCLTRVGKTSIEKSIEAMVKRVDEGLVCDLCLSEVSAETIRKAHKIIPLAAVETEFSMFSRESEFNGVFDVCKELNIPVIAYSPLGRGALTGKFDIDSLSKDDLRRNFDRFKGKIFNKNLAIVNQLRHFADSKGATVSQIALSWIRTLSGTGNYPTIIPIPSSTKPERVAENNKHVDLKSDDMDKLEQLLCEVKVEGHRYNEMMDSTLYK